MRDRQFVVYILSSHSRVLYVGITSDLCRRLAEHRKGVPGSFTARYRATRLVYYEVYRTAWEAIRREKAIKRWVRRKKTALVRGMNPGWRDLSATVCGPIGAGRLRDPSLRSG